MRNEGENLGLRKTQGDLLQKLRHLRLWQQQQQEQLLQDKEKKMTIIKEQEKKFQLVQEYQKKALASGLHGSRGTVPIHDQSNGSMRIYQPNVSDQKAPMVTVRRFDLNQNVSMLPTAGNLVLSKTTLLSPNHFEVTISKDDTSPLMNSPVTVVQNPMLLAQRIQIPVLSDDELSQYSEDDDTSSDIDGVIPIIDTASEVASGDENEYKHSDQGQSSDENNDVSDEQNETLVEKQEKNEKQEKQLDDHSVTVFDDIPIKTGSGAKTFDQLLNEKLGSQSGTNNEIINEQPTAKKTFLRKGEGIARFGLKPKPPFKKKTKTTQPEQQDEEQNNILTRKIAVNKPLNRDQVKPDVQEQRTNKNVLSSHVIGSYPSIDIAIAPSIGKYSKLSVVSQQKMVGVHAIEDSFQERMKQYDEMEIVEKHELSEFELLEEAAANSSLSSNSSTVLRILGGKSENARKKFNLINGRQQTRKRVNTLGMKRGDVNEELFDSTQLDKQQESEDDDDKSDDENNDTLTKSQSNDDDDDHDDDDDGDGDDDGNTMKNQKGISTESSLTRSNGFNDSETWDQLGDLDLSDVHDDPMVSLNTSTPNEKNKSRYSIGSQRESPQTSTPPTSNLVTKLFPQLKAKNNAQFTSEKLGHAEKQSPKRTEENTISVEENKKTQQDGAVENSFVMGSAVREKLQELEKEIEKFREENAMLHKLREEREKDLQDLHRERTLFDNHKTDELEKLEKFKAEEERRLRRDKRVFEQYQRASRALPDKKEREEILTLKNKINELQEELKLRESRWSAAAGRYKDRLNNLENENKEMKEEIKLLEKQNLELQRKEQQKTRELQQYKAFEERKLTKSEGEAAKSSLSGISSDVGCNEKPKTPPRSPILQKSNKTTIVASDPSHIEQESKVDKPITKEHTTISEIQRAKKMQTNPLHHETAESCDLSTKQQSPPPLTRSGKTVRFQDELSKPETQPKEICHNDGKREVINLDGSRVVTFQNGTKKEISSDGLSVIVTFFNGDVKQVMPDKRVVYYYAEAQTTHTTYQDGLQVLHFPSNQIEKHYPDGTKEIIFPDQTVKYLYQSGDEECVFADGTIERITGDGERIVEFPNGQRETYTKLFKKREYPDGTVKTVFTDGRQETRYPSGRLRVKDGEGRLLVDTAEQQ